MSASVSAALRPRSQPPLFALAAILALAAGLRLAWLGHMSLWMDEGFTAAVASAPWNRLASTAVDVDWHPLGQYVLAKLGLLAFSGGEWGLRLPSAICGILTVAAMYPLAREVFAADPPDKAVAATALAATMAMLVLANRDARSYSPAILGLTLATLGWCAALRAPSERRQRWWALWVTAGLGAAYCHYYTLLVLAWEWIVATKIQPRARCWWITLPLVAACYAPAIPRLGHHLSLTARGHAPPGWYDMVDVFFSQTVGFTLNFSSIWVWYGLAACGLTAAASGLWARSALNPRPPIFRVAIVYWGFVATLVGVPLISPKGVFETKYFVLLSPLFVLLMTNAICTLPWRSLRHTVLLGLIALNLTSSLNAIAVEEWHRQDFRGATEIIAREQRAGDTLVLDPDLLQYVARFYLGARATELSWLPLPPRTSLAVEAGKLATRQRIWLLRAAMASTGGPNPEEEFPGRQVLLHWKSHRRVGLLEVELFLFSSAAQPVSETIPR